MAALSPPTSMKDKPLKHTYALIRNVFEHSEYMIQRPAPGFQILIGGARQFEENEGVLLQDGSISQKVSNYLRRAISGYFPNETGYPDDISLESAPKLRESFMDRFSKLQISAGLDAWDAAEGAGMFMSSSFHQQPPPKSQPAASSFPPPAKELHAEQEWSGTMGYSRDEHPFVGRIPVIGKAAAGRLEIPEMNDTKGLWVCAGFQGHGMAFVSGSAKVLGGMIARDEAEGSRDAEAWKKVEDWFPETFIITPERLRLNLGKDGMEMEESENDWVIVNGYQAEVDKE